MNEQTAVQELKAERVQGQSTLKRQLAKPDDAIGREMALTRSRVQERLKAERVQLRLKRMQGWKMQSTGKAIDRARQFTDPLVAASYLAFAALLARQAGQPLRASVQGATIILALPGRSKEGLTEAVLDLAEQLG